MDLADVDKRKGNGHLPPMNGGASFAGLPAISVPVGFGANRLAFGLQVIAPRKQDERLLSFVKLMEPLYLDSREASVSL